VHAALLAVMSALPLAAITGVPASDVCTSPPEIAVELPPVDEDRGPVYVNGYVWSGGSIYTPDGSFVREAPIDGFLRGETREFNAEIVDPSGATWGVVGEGSTGYGVYTPSGEHIVDLPPSSFVEAVYDGDYILASEAINLGQGPLRTFLVTRDGTIRTLPASVGEENDRYGAVVADTIYIVEQDGTLALFGPTGDRLGEVRSSVGFSQVFADHGFAYATTKRHTDGSFAVVVLDAASAEVNRLDYPAGSLELRASEHGLVAQFNGLTLEDLGEITAQVQLPTEVTLLTPTGHEVATYLGDESEDRVFKAHGRYVMIADHLSETPWMEDPPHPGSITSRIELIHAGGEHIGDAGDVEHIEYAVGRPAGTLVAYYGPDGRSLEFRGLDGRVLGHMDFGPKTHSIELTMTDHEFLWVRTAGVTQVGSTEEIARTFVLDLGECAGLPSSGTFVDDDNSVFEPDIEWLSAVGITRGCDPQHGATRYCPDEVITRGQMAAFFRRALGTTESAGQPVEFDDVAASEFSDDIEWLAAAGITAGCTPTRFCPDDPVTRSQMAAFLTRALGLPPADPASFDDIAGSVFADDVARLAGSGITRGCTATSFCPDDPVTRAQMAAFFHRALG